MGIGDIFSDGLESDDAYLEVLQWLEEKPEVFPKLDSSVLDRLVLFFRESSLEDDAHIDSMGLLNIRVGADVSAAVCRLATAAVSRHSDYLRQYEHTNGLLLRVKRRLRLKEIKADKGSQSHIQIGLFFQPLQQ